jgi:hypothetical protein
VWASRSTLYSISWSDESLLNLVIRRLIRNDRLRDYYAVDAQAVLQDFEQQRDLFYKVFPDLARVRRCGGPRA